MLDDKPDLIPEPPAGPLNPIPDPDPFEWVERERDASGRFRPNVDPAVKALRPANTEAMLAMDGTRKEKTRKKRDAQLQVLGLIAQGLTIDVAMAQVGRTMAAYRKWMWVDNDPWFKRRVELIRKGVTENTNTAFRTFRLSNFGYDTYWHHQEMIDAIEKAKPGSITLILLPPEWGKSTLMEDYICYTLGPIDPNHRFCVISESTTQSRKMVRRIQNRMTDTMRFPAYISAYGPFKAPDDNRALPWNADFMSILKADADERDPSLEARGAGSALYGSRYDTIICDDIQSVQTLAKTESLLEFFRSDLLTRPGTNGRIIIVGTRIGSGDFYERIIEEDLVDNIVKIPALNEAGESNYPEAIGPNGKTIGWSEENLRIRRHKVGEEIWARVYMQEPVSKAGQTFTPRMIEDSWDFLRDIGLPENNDYLGVLASVDPGLGGGHCSMKLGGMLHQRLELIDTLDATGLGRFEDIFDYMEHFTKLYTPMAWIIEVNAMQKGLARDERLKKMSEQYGFRIIENETRTNKTDPQIGVAAMAGAFLRHEITMPHGTEAARKKFALLCKQLDRWRFDVPTRYLVQDEVMSLWFMWRWWNQLRRSFRPDALNWQTGGIPYGMTPTDVALGRVSPQPAGARA